MLLEDDHAEEGDAAEEDTVGGEDENAEEPVVDVVAALEEGAASRYEPHARVPLRIRDHEPFQRPLGVAQVREEGVLLLRCYQSQHYRKQR